MKRSSTADVADASRAGGAEPADTGSHQGSVAVTLGTMRFPPGYAGPALRFQRYHPRFVRRGIDMDVCALGAAPEARTTRTHAGIPAIEEDVGGIRVERLQMPLSKAAHSMHHRYARGLAAFVAHRRPAVVQLLQLSPWGLWGLAALRRLGVPVVFTETMMPDEVLQRPIRGAHWRFPFKLLDRVVVSSSAMRDAMRESGVGTPIDIIPNGVDLDRFHPLDDDARDRTAAELGLAPGSPVVVFIGGYISHRKGVDVLAEAWPRIEGRYPDAQLVMVGPDDVAATEAPGTGSAFIEAIKERLAPGIAEGRVRFTGSVDNVEHYLQVADVFVFPSRKEGMPNVIPEGCACATPIVLTAFEGLSAEMGRPGETFELVDRVPDALAGAVLDLLANPGRRKELGASARKWVEGNMDVERSVDAYAELYRSLARSTHRL